MRKNQIIEVIHKIREAHARKFNPDTEIAEDESMRRE